MLRIFISLNFTDNSLFSLHLFSPSRYLADPSLSAVIAPECVERLSPGEKFTLLTVSLIYAGLCAAIGAAIFFWRATRTLHAASPLFCALIAGGAAMVAVSCVLVVLPRTPGSCAGSVWLFHIGFSLAFGALFTKNWRLSRIFNNVELRAISISNEQLLAGLGGLIAVDITLLSLWTGVQPFSVPAYSDVLCLSGSSASGGEGFISALLALKGALVIWGIYLVYQVRDVPSAFNESRHLALAVYNAALSAAVYVAIYFSLRDYFSPTAMMRVEWAMKLVVGSATLGIIFGPKFASIVFHGDGSQGKVAAARLMLKRTATGDGSSHSDLGLKRSASYHHSGDSGSSSLGNDGRDGAEDVGMVDAATRTARLAELQKCMDASRKRRDKAAALIKQRENALEEAVKAAADADDEASALSAEIDYQQSLVVGSGGRPGVRLQEGFGYRRTDSTMSTVGTSSHSSASDLGVSTLSDGGDGGHSRPGSSMEMVPSEHASHAAPMPATISMALTRRIDDEETGSMLSVDSHSPAPSLPPPLPPRTHTSAMSMHHLLQSSAALHLPPTIGSIHHSLDAADTMALADSSTLSSSSSSSSDATAALYPVSMSQGWGHIEDANV